MMDTDKKIIEDLLQKQKLKDEHINIIQNYLVGKTVLYQERCLKKIADRCDLTVTVLRKDLQKRETNVSEEEKRINSTKAPYGSFELTADVANALLSLRCGSGSSQIVTIMEQFIDKHPIYFDTKTKLWWIWNDYDLRWELGCDIEIMRIFKNKYGFVEWVDAKLKNQMLTALQTVAEKKPKDLPVEWIQFKDVAINFKTGETMIPTPEYFFTNPIVWNLGECEETPTLDKFFEDWVGKENLQAMYEIVSYCLLRSYPIGRIFFFVGSGANGKTTFLKVISKFIGTDNRTSSELERLKESRFESAKLMNRLLCEIGETSINYIDNTAILKALTGETPIPAEIKNSKGLFEFVNFAKIIISTNNLPITSDISDGFFRRTFVLDFPNKFAEKMDLIKTVPDKEFENLGRKCIRLLKELIERGKFDIEGDFDERKLTYEKLSNPLIDFIHTFYKEDPDGFVLKTDFKTKFQKYLQKIKHYKRFTSRDINEVIKHMGLEQIKKRTDTYDSNPRWGIHGLTERTDNDEPKDKSSEKLLEDYVPQVPNVPYMSTPFTIYKSESGNMS